MVYGGCLSARTDLSSVGGLGYSQILFLQVLSGQLCYVWHTIIHSSFTRKWLISIVFPGVDDVMARPFFPVSIFISDDLPTFERPMNAYSWRCSLGQSAAFVLLIMNLAVFTIMIFKSWLT